MRASKVSARQWPGGAALAAIHGNTSTDTPRTALGSVDANQYFALLRNGVDLPVGKFGVLAPFVELEMQHAESPGFTETGTDSVNLAVSGNTANSMRSLLGAQWRKEFDWLGHAWNLDGGAEF
ncbi:autotransporter outer membrane beta-barrel domain-containing protein [Caballeronia mineralivorans]|jgi:uncharacterized protein YhjY with autotransporter beta-barrel domain|uniref:autotransporter outer membrane beta-barrel domain-containing protein n=1 Tax=Caballeronia mineralivorans TaxID=2010198 RepID=UPI0023F36330|nr:autotransporter outer membrane beta-barrel domain-containing protein [Caballeronia mineralivorans]MDB5783246.1 hypothetical protein [Caballeronia mineralivorans]MEA3101961.1 hypothetical protein [Caballeronia mineralivorans]